MGGDRDVESWEGALAFCSQNTLVPLQHHPQPSAPTSLQLSLSALLYLSQVVWQPPEGDFVTDTSGWGGEGQGMRHEGVRKGLCTIEKVSLMGWQGVTHLCPS